MKMTVELSTGVFEERQIDRLQHESVNLHQPKSRFPELPKYIPMLKQGEKIIWRVGTMVPLIVNY